MRFVPPPQSLTSEEYAKRWAAGARTLEELDPAFWKWCRNNERRNRVFVIAAIGMLIIGFLICI